MGYSFDAKGGLCCDICGASKWESGKAVRKRTCPYKVSGRWGALPYCPAPAVCAGCYTTHKTNLHADCKAGAAKIQAEYDQEQTALEAGELLVKAAWGDWHERIPTGMVGVSFAGLNGPEEFRLLLEDEYRGGSKLSDYPNAQVWEGPS